MINKDGKIQIRLKNKTKSNASKHTTSFYFGALNYSNINFLKKEKMPVYIVVYSAQGTNYSSIWLESTLSKMNIAFVQYKR